MDLAALRENPYAIKPRESVTGAAIEKGQSFSRGNIGADGGPINQIGRGINHIGSSGNGAGDSELKLTVREGSGVLEPHIKEQVAEINGVGCIAEIGLNAKDILHRP